MNADKKANIVFGWRKHSPTLLAFVDPELTSERVNGFAQTPQRRSN